MSKVKSRRVVSSRRTKKSAWIVGGTLALILPAALVLGIGAAAVTGTAAGGSDERADVGALSALSANPLAEAEADPDPAVAVADVTAADVTAADDVTAAALLETLPVKGRAPKTGYDRKAMFGTPWLDVDRNGCDTRNDVLARDLTDIDRPSRCKVLAGILNDPYTGRTIDFVRGNTTSTAVQIDHVVALMDSWQKGAQQLSQDQRIALANDPMNLLAVDGPTNSQKGASDAASWLPPQKSFRCEYVARQVSVKAMYNLWVTQAEHDAIARILTGCPDQPAFTSTYTAPAPKPTETAVPVPAPAEPAPAPEAPAPVVPDPNVFYANCTAVRAAGAAPIRVGDPGYSYKLDRDRDGVGCE